MHFEVFQSWSRLVELPSSDEMKMFYTDHDFKVDLENLRVQLECVNAFYITIDNWFK